VQSHLVSVVSLDVFRPRNSNRLKQWNCQLHCLARPTSRFGPAYGSRGQSLVAVASHGDHPAERSEPMMCVLTTISISVARVLHECSACKPQQASRAESQVSQHTTTDVRTALSPALLLRWGARSRSESPERRRQISAKLRVE
jgi:hypothetical protein